MLGVAAFGTGAGGGGRASAREPQVGLPWRRLVASPWTGGTSAWRSRHSSAVKRQSFLFFQNLPEHVRNDYGLRGKTYQHVFVFGRMLVNAPSCGVAIW